MKYKKINKPGYQRDICPMCGHNTYDYCSYHEGEWGVVEHHGECIRCGYFTEMCYSPVLKGIRDNKKGYRDYQGVYHPKDVKRHKRIRRKAGITNKQIEINQPWMYRL